MEEEGSCFFRCARLVCFISLFQPPQYIYIHFSVSLRARFTAAEINQELKCIKVLPANNKWMLHNTPLNQSKPCWDTVNVLCWTGTIECRNVIALCFPVFKHLSCINMSAFMEYSKFNTSHLCHKKEFRLVPHFQKKHPKKVIRRQLKCMRTMFAGAETLETYNFIKALIWILLLKLVYYLICSNVLKLCGF